MPRAKLEVARPYWWRVTGRCVRNQQWHLVPSETASFATEDRAPRWIEVEGRVGNFRDFGGRRTADGRRVRQGMAYRGQGLNDNSVTGEEPGRNRLTTEDVLSGRKREDAVARKCSFVIDIHNPAGAGQSVRRVGAFHLYGRHVHLIGFGLE